MTSLPHLELGDVASPFDEAVILINGHEEETITIECAGAIELAERLAAIVNNHELVLKTLEAAMHALRSYEYGNSAPDLARSVADDCETLSKQVGAAA
jgi:hypothetical protein